MTSSLVLAAQVERLKSNKLAAINVMKVFFTIGLPLFVGGKFN
jgi:hypothetical protein